MIRRPDYMGKCSAGRRLKEKKAQRATVYSMRPSVKALIYVDEICHEIGL